MQLNLFDSVNIRYNKGVGLLTDLRFDEAEHVFDDYSDSYPGLRDISFEKWACQKLRGFHFTDSSNDVPSIIRMVSVWKEVEQESTKRGRIDDLFIALRRSIFRAITTLLDRVPSDGYSDFTTYEELSRWYVYADRFDQAFHILSRQIPKSSSTSGRIFGYLGDICVKKQNYAEALEYYREAFSRNPEQVDIESLADDRILSFLDSLEDDESIPKPVIFWIASAGLIRGILPYPELKTAEQVKCLVEEYMELSKQNTNDSVVAERLFYLALVLDQRTKGVNLTAVVDQVEFRRVMRKLAPGLFDEYLAQLELSWICL